MSLTVKNLNSDSSFLLSFQPISSSPPASPGQSANAFTILLDPWISGPSTIWHSKLSISRQKATPCISSLAEIPEPDIVVISQAKSDHCNKETLTQLSRGGGKSIILAVPAAARVIRGWKYFEANKVVTLPKWEDLRHRRSPTVHRIPIERLSPNGKMGEVTIAYLPQKGDLSGLHSAIGITCRPPTGSLITLPLTPPASPGSRSPICPSPATERALSVIYSPHGCTYKTLSPYVTSHLIAEAALPLTALLHCFHRVTNSWYLGGNISSGFPGGLEIAQNLCARAWISTHDGERDVSGLATTNIVVKKYKREQVENAVSPRSERFANRRMGTEAVVLDGGEEKFLSHAMDFAF